MKTVYISGPMTGYDDLNFPAFNEAEEILIARGFKVINPAKIEQPDKSWEACMKLDIVELMGADMVITLPNWEKSKGARLEVDLAIALGMEVRTLANDAIIERLQQPHRAPKTGLPKLSKRQAEALQTIVAHIDANGYAPSVRELTAMMGLTSSSTAHAFLDQLERKGYIKRVAPRAIQIISRGSVKVSEIH